MNLETFLKNYAAKIIGFSMIICNSLFLFQIIKLFYQYHFTTILFFMMLSDAVLLILSILFSTGIGIGVLIFKKKITYLKWSFIDFELVILAFVIEHLDSM